MVSNTIDDFPEPESPVKIVICRLGTRREMSFRLFSRAPRISMNSFIRPCVSSHGSGTSSTSASEVGLLHEAQHFRIEVQGLLLVGNVHTGQFDLHRFPSCHSHGHCRDTTMTKRKRRM